MGEASEMILEGILCQICGAYMEDHEENPYPRSCYGCEPEGEDNSDG